MEAEAIRTRLALVQERISLSLARSGRSHEHVLLVVVSKGQPLHVLQAAYQAGISIFGENYPEEAVMKMAHLNQAIRWHMIGHLQSRKSALVASHFHYFHALDSVKLAARLNRQLDGKNRKLPVLLEINIGNEKNKYGWLWENEQDWKNLILDVTEISLLPNLTIRGLMAMPPYNVQPEMTRPFFRRMRILREALNREFSELSMNELSMGTSVDYGQAIEEGATMVRIGEAILGPRVKRREVSG